MTFMLQKEMHLLHPSNRCMLHLGLKKPTGSGCHFTGIIKWRLLSERNTTSETWCFWEEGTQAAKMTAHLAPTIR
jgi:hypothetical protein